jgi:hypothetical protein
VGGRREKLGVHFIGDGREREGVTASSSTMSGIHQWGEGVMGEGTDAVKLHELARKKTVAGVGSWLRRGLARVVQASREAEAQRSARCHGRAGGLGASYRRGRVARARSLHGVGRSGLGAAGVHAARRAGRIGERSEGGGESWVRERETGGEGERGSLAEAATGRGRRAADFRVRVVGCWASWAGLVFLFFFFFYFFFC